MQVNQLDSYCRQPIISYKLSAFLRHFTCRKRQRLVVLDVCHLCLCRSFKPYVTVHVYWRDYKSNKKTKETLITLRRVMISMFTQICRLSCRGVGSGRNGGQKGCTWSRRTEIVYGSRLSRKLLSHTCVLVANVIVLRAACALSSLVAWHTKNRCDPDHTNLYPV